jgi:glycosyltransferase involved in cell wall biosynthesis
VVSWLTDELVDLGCRVTLFASGDSVTSGTLVPAWPHALRLIRGEVNEAAAYSSLLESIAARAKDFDVIHAHLDWIHLPLLTRVEVPFITTLHGRLDLANLTIMANRFPHASFVSVSDNQRSPLANLNWVGTVYHGMPANILKAQFTPGDYLAFLGRITPEKGPETAIRVAQSVRMPLKIAAKVPRAGNRYFRERIEPMLIDKSVEFIGEVDDRAKQSFLGNATALLFPIDWPEPFGLVMIEAMACGTPVIAWRRGSVPEIVEDGVSGFIVESEAEAVEAIHRVRDLDRGAVRAVFDQRFTAGRMATNYLQLYRAAIDARIPAG